MRLTNQTNFLFLFLMTLALCLVVSCKSREIDPQPTESPEHTYWRNSIDSVLSIGGELIQGKLRAVEPKETRYDITEGGKPVVEHKGSDSYDVVRPGYYRKIRRIFDFYGYRTDDDYIPKLSEEAEAQIEKIYFDDALIERSQKQMLEIGAAKRIDDVIGRYIVQIKNSFPKNLSLHGLRVVLDVANGAAYKVAPTIFSELGAETIVINDEPNGSNINLNCGALYPQNLASEVVRLRADLGFALDGDADRLVVVDECGEVANGDSLLGVMAAFLQENKALKGADPVPRPPGRGRR